jgi:hypothetical protein
MGRGAEAAAQRAGGAFGVWQARIITVNQALDLSRRVIGAFSSVVNGLVSAFSAVTAAASEQEDAEARRNAVLRTSGQLTREYAQELNAQAAAFQQATRFGDEAVIGVQEQLIAFGASRDQIRALTQTVLDFATFQRTDAVDAARLFGRAIQGQTELFSRYGIRVTEGATAAQKLAQVQRQVNEMVGGLAQSGVETYSGRVAQLSNAWSDLKEELGLAIQQNQSLIDVLGLAKNIIGEYTGAIAGNKVAMQIWISDALIQGLEVLRIFNDVLGFTVTTMAATAIRIDALTKKDFSVFFKTNEELVGNLEEGFFRINNAIDQLIAKAVENRGKTGALLEESAGGLRNHGTGANEASKQSIDFAKSLAEQNQQLELQLIELTKGKAAAEEYSLQLLTEKAAQIGLTGAIVQQIDARRQLLGDLREELQRRRDMEQLIKQSTANLPFELEEEITFGIPEKDLREALDKARATAQEKAQSVTDLERTITLELLSESERRIQTIRNEFDDRAKLIEEWRAAQILAGEDVIQINARAADLTNRAWESAYDKMQENTDEFTEFERRQFERMFDSLSNAINDVLDGDIRSWKDFGLRIKQVLDEITADILAMQLKILVFGEDFGKQGGKVGGLAGKLEEIVGGIFGGGKEKPPLSERIPGGEIPDEGGSFEEMQRVWALASQTQEATAVTAIQTAAATADASIQAQSATAQASIQTIGTTVQTAAQTAIEGTVSVGTTSIQAVQAAAIAAIQAQQAAASVTGGGGGGASGLLGGLGGVFGLFGGGGAAAAVGGGGLSIAPGLLESTFAGLALPFHKGGTVGVTDVVPRLVDPKIFLNAPRYHEGTKWAGLAPDEVPAILQKGEKVTPREQRATESQQRDSAKRPIIVNQTFNVPKDADWRSLKRHDGQMAAMARRAIDKASREV